MLKLKWLCFVALFILLAGGNAQAQGISSILERLDTLENRVDTMGATLEMAAGTSSDSSSEDLLAYGQTLTEFEVQLARLQNEVTTVSQQSMQGVNPQIEIRLAELEQQNKDLVPLLEELKADQEAGFAGIQSSLQANPPAPAVAEEAPVCSASSLEPPCTETVISGFVDASYYYDGQSGEGSFGLDQVEVDIERTIGTAGSLRVDVEWVSDGAGGFDSDVEQGFVTYSPEFSGEGYFTFGKFNAPIGFELLDAPDMYQYSHALVFDYGLPTNLTGIMYSTQLNSSFDVSAYVCNGWDVNVDPDNDKTIGGRLGFSGDNWGGIGISAIHGDDAVDDTTSSKLTVFDVDASLNPAENLLFGAEFNLGKNDFGAYETKWWGLLLMTHYDFSPTVGGTLRFDYFDDQDNSRLGGADPEVRTAITLSPTFVLGDGMGALLEFRWDSSDVEVFTDSGGAPTKTAFTMAFEMTYTF